ncbi:LacI family transcriptional regulator [Deinococcus metalli]|uniref:LacI family transcriptional regulator n=1 Tax=Deinococcus metalli TaxID=1141878 RepID=A0A7W8KIA1_9DEIO|nr:LacI family DNA-binding transcriptional regulator [Deinococcus metalli]MBB5377693.1 LacI family transcriptional regulator [Deinococcus metalli]GHF52601.1 LacI family transcriptional regulator [Deinococcus metalli]
MTTPEKSPTHSLPDRARSQNVTIHDVARHSGVSYQTVSRVINNHANVAQQTRARVLQTIEELNYRPSLLAKGLVTRRSQLIGVVAHGMNQYGPSQILQNVQESAHEVGYQIMLTTLQQVDLEYVQEQDVLTAARRLQQFGVDGLVLLTNYDAHDIARGLGDSLPFVMIDATPDVHGPTVSIDQFGGAVTAARHLSALGHRRLLHISGPPGWSDARLRREGFESVVQRDGLDILPPYEGDWSAYSGYHATLRALDDGLDFTGVFASNDQMALGVLSALKSRGLKVPGDVSVIGFDDTPEAAHYDPPLTTVRQDFGQLGRKSLEELLRLIQEPAGRERHYVFGSQLVVRATTAPPRESPAR